MSECPHFRSCPFFTDKLPAMPALATLFKIKYCMGDFPACARYLVSQVLGRRSVPQDLLPAEKEKAEEIILTS
jgi:hypothetical protein